MWEVSFLLPQGGCPDPSGLKRQAPIMPASDAPDATRAPRIAAGDIPNGKRDIGDFVLAGNNAALAGKNVADDSKRVFQDSKNVVQAGKKVFPEIRETPWGILRRR